MIDLMCWAAPRPSSPVTTWNEIRYQDMNAPARMTTVPVPQHEMSLPSDCGDRDRFSRASIHGRGKFNSRRALALAFSARSVGRAAQFRSALGFGRFRPDLFRLRLGLHRLELGALDRRRLDPPRHFGTCVSRARRLLPTKQRARSRHGARQQHLRGALMAEITIGEAHARDGATERAIVALVDIEARLERKSLDRSTNGLTANLQGIAGQANIADGARTAELDRAGCTEIVEDAASAAGAIETGEGENLAVHKPASLIGIHHPGQCGNDHRGCRDGPQNQTRKHAATPSYQGARAPAFPPCLPYQPWQYWSR